MTSDDNIKKKWIDKLFNNKVFTIIGVLTFDSKNWYAFEEKNINGPKYLLVYFGTHQPSAKNLLRQNYYEIIEFENLDQLPSTLIPIEEAVTIIHDATINVNFDDNNTILNKLNNILSIIDSKLKRTTNSYESRTKLDNNMIFKNIYSDLIDYNYLSYLYKMTIFKKLSLEYEKKWDNCINLCNISSLVSATSAFAPLDPNYKTHQLTDNLDDNRSLLVVCHGVYIGNIVEKEHIGYRYKSCFDLGSYTNKRCNVVNLNQSGFELDNRWNYNSAVYNIGLINNENDIMTFINGNSISNIKFASLSNTDIQKVNLSTATDTNHQICNIICQTQKNKFIDTELNHNTRKISTIINKHSNDIYDEIYNEGFTVEELVKQTEEKENGK